MMRALLALLVGCGGCGAAQRPAARAGGFALVWKGAWLRASARTDAPRARWFDTPAARQEVGEAFVGRVVADHGDDVEVENVGVKEADAHCYGTIGALDPVRLHIHVARSDVREVTTRDVEVR